mgnify:CR=1 FL=1
MFKEMECTTTDNMEVTKDKITTIITVEVTIKTTLRDNGKTITSLSHIIPLTRWTSLHLILIQMIMSHFTQTTTNSSRFMRMEKLFTLSQTRMHPVFIHDKFFMEINKMSISQIKGLQLMLMGKCPTVSMIQIRTTTELLAQRTSSSKWNSISKTTPRC